MLRCAVLLIVSLSTVVGCGHTHYSVANYPQRAEIKILDHDQIDKLYEQFVSKNRTYLSILERSFCDNGVFSLDDSVLYAAYTFMNNKDARSKESLDKAIYYIQQDRANTTVFHIEMHITQPELREQAIRLVAYMNDPLISKRIVEMTEHFMSRDLARLYISSGDKLLIESGKRWLNKKNYPVLKNPLRMVVYQMDEAEVDALSEKILSQERTSRSTTLGRHELDNFIYAAAVCYAKPNCWSHSQHGRMINEALRAMDEQTVVQALSRQIYHARYRKAMISMALQLKFQGTEERFSSILTEDEDTRGWGYGMATDFLNSGSKKLSDAAYEWASKHGLTVRTYYKNVNY